jgi:hypothetical protein
LVPGRQTLFVNAAMVGIGGQMRAAQRPPVVVELLLQEDTSNVDVYVGYGERSGPMM